ncbi:MAG: GDSL-type esterase/lipase family protein, partial [Verrucomicrobiota bacterium]
KPISAEPWAENTSEITNDGGIKAIGQTRAWNPIIRIPLKDLGEGQVALWVQHRNGPVQLKALSPIEGQIERKWSWENSAKWNWAMLYSGPVDELEGDLIVIRGNANDGPATEIGQIVIDKELTWAPKGKEAPSGTASISQPSGWAPPSWNDRRKSFAASRDQDKGGIVFLGDSITKGFKLDKFFPGQQMVNHGIVGDLSQNMALRLKEDVLPLEPKALVILAGTNDLKDNHPADKVSQRLLALCDTMHKNNAETEVILCLIMPRGIGKNPERVSAANELLKSGAKERPWLKVCDLWTPMALPDGSANPDYFGDGVHPISAGYKVWAEVIKQFLPGTSSSESSQDSYS